MAIPTSTIGLLNLGLRNLVYAKFGTLLGVTSVNKGVIFFPKEVAQREYAEKQDKDIVNFASLWLNRTSFSWERQRTPVGRRGMGLAFTDSNSTEAVTATAVPADLDYQLTFWTTDLDTMHKLVEEFLYWVYSNPSLVITIGGFPMQPYLRFKEITDDSTVKNMYNVGKYFVYDCVIKMDGWLPRFSQEYVIKEIILTGYTGSETNKIQVFHDIITS